MLDLNCLTEHINDEVHVRYDLNAFRSSLVQDCIGRCLDLVEGGALYSADGGPTAGTISAGDALTGIINGFLSQGVSLEQAALLSAYIHGKIADRLGKSSYIVNARDIIGELPKEINTICN